MGNSLWTTNAADLEKEKRDLLAPRDNYNVKCLAYLRAIAALYFTGHVILVVTVTYDEFWKFLTNLTYILCMPAYQMLFYAHIKNGDFTKQAYVSPSTEDLRSNKAPFHVFKAAQFMYELGVHLALTVALAFWMVEMPAMALEN